MRPLTKICRSKHIITEGMGALCYPSPQIFVVMSNKPNTEGVRLEQEVKILRAIIACLIDRINLTALFPDSQQILTSDVMLGIQKDFDEPIITITQNGGIIDVQRN